MKTSFRFLLPLMALAFSLGFLSLHAQDAPPPPDQQQGAPPPDQGAPPPDQQGGDDQGASFQEFYDQLGGQGNWIQTDDYGYVFQPNVSDPGWAPYSDGHWVYSDAGWVWVSEEPWGWATYHYGRWANIYGTGWVWVPGYQWAPAWVSWRYGGGYCGWAPLPPATFIGVEYGNPGVALGIGFHFGGDVDVSFNIGPGCYNFVRVGDMGYPNYRGRYLDRSRNFVVINNTTNITNINVNRNAGAGFRGVAVGGPPINEINAHAGTPIPTVRLTSAYQPGRSTLNGNTLSVFAPHVNPATLHQARPATVSQTIARPTFNRGDSITKPLAVNARLTPTAPTEAQISQARDAAAHASPTAKIATEKTVARTSITKPLTSMQPVAQVRSTGTGTANSSFKPATTTQPGTTRNTESSFTGAPANTQRGTTSEVHSNSTGQPSTSGVQHTTTSPYTGGSNTERQSTERSTSTPYTGESNAQRGTTERSTSSSSTGEPSHTATPSYQEENRSVQRETTPPVQHQTAPTQAAPVSHPQAEPQRSAAPQGNGNSGNKNQNQNQNGANGQGNGQQNGRG